MGTVLSSSRTHQAGGTALLIAGILFIVAFVGFLALQPAPSASSTAEGALILASEKKAFLGGALAALIAAHIFLIPSVMGLYRIWDELRRSPPLIGTGIALVAIALFLAKATSLVSILLLSDAYAAATSDEGRAAVVADANLVILTTEAGFDFYNILLGVWAILLALAIRKTKKLFHPALAYLGFVAGVVLMLGGPLTAKLDGGELPFLISYALLGAWLLVLGGSLLRLGFRRSDRPA